MFRLFRKRVNIHQCTHKVGPGETKWQADWRTGPSTGSGYSVQSDEGSDKTKAALLNNVEAYLREDGITRVKFVETDCCEWCCRHL